MTGRLVLLAGVCLLAATAAVAGDKTDAGDRAALAACFERVGKSSAGQFAECIGVVQDRCIEASDRTTASTNECTGREIALWDERLNEAYRKVLAQDIAKLKTQRAWGGGRAKEVTGADILRNAQRAWITFRDLKCDAAGLPMEGGTGASLLSTGCYLQETARQALWLESLDADR